MQVDPDLIQQAPIPAPQPAPEEEQVDAEVTDLAAQQIRLMTMGDLARAAGHGLPTHPAAPAQPQQQDGHPPPPAQPGQPAGQDDGDLPDFDDDDN